MASRPHSGRVQKRQEGQQRCDELDHCGKLPHAGSFLDELTLFQFAVLQCDLTDFELHAPPNQLLYGDLIGIAVAVSSIGHQEVHPVGMRDNRDLCRGIRVDFKLFIITSL